MGLGSPYLVCSHCLGVDCRLALLGFWVSSLAYFSLCGFSGLLNWVSDCTGVVSLLASSTVLSCIDGLSWRMVWSCCCLWLLTGLTVTQIATTLTTATLTVATLIAATVIVATLTAATLTAATLPPATLTAASVIAATLTAVTRTAALRQQPPDNDSNNNHRTSQTATLHSVCPNYFWWTKSLQ